MQNIIGVNRKKEIDEVVTKHDWSCSYFQLNHGESLIHMTAEFPGMVGESVTAHRWLLVKPDIRHGMHRVHDLTPEEVRYLYNRVKGQLGRHRSINMFYFIRPATRKGMKEEADAQRAEAISRVI